MGSGRDHSPVAASPNETTMELRARIGPRGHHWIIPNNGVGPGAPGNHINHSTGGDERKKRNKKGRGEKNGRRH